MLSAFTPKSLEITGTTVFRMVLSICSMKKPTATSHGAMRRMRANWASVTETADMRVQRCHYR